MPKESDGIAIIQMVEQRKKITNRTKSTARQDMNNTNTTGRLYTRETEVNSWKEFFTEESKDWNLFTLTVVFRKVDANSNKHRYEHEYNTRVLNKIRRRLESCPRNQPTALPFEDMFYYEKDIGSIFKKTSSQSPHHIHALLPIKKRHMHRFWCIDLNDINARLRKDLESIDVVQSVLIEQAIPETLEHWIRYISKRKEI
jgi:hypothetical protein